MSTPLCIEAAKHALVELNCANDSALDSRAAIVAQHLAEVDGVALVVDESGAPRTRTRQDGTGRSEPVPIVVLIDELRARLRANRSDAFRRSHGALAW